VINNEIVAYKDTSDNSVDLTWDTNTVVDANYTLAGRIFYDDSNGQATVEDSDPITVVVANNQAATILSPKNAATVSGLVPVKFSVTAQSVSAELYVDNQLRVGPVAIPANSVTATLDYDSTVDANGPHTLTVKVTDGNNQVTSDSITVNVANSFADINVQGPQDFIAATGFMVSYTIHVINAGPDDDTIVTMTHPLLANTFVDPVTFKALNPNLNCQVNQDIVCIFPLPGPNNQNIDNFVDITVVKTYLAPGIYPETITAFGTGVDVNLNDNMATFTATIQ
jgi:hypothetical protein